MFGGMDYEAAHFIQYITGSSEELDLWGLDGRVRRQEWKAGANNEGL